MRNEEEGTKAEIRGFQDLLVWQRSMDLTEEIYRLTGRLPDREKYGLTQQLRRAAVSVPSNIAEGHSRQSTGDYRHHLQIARGSAAEVQTQLLLTQRLGMLSSQDNAKALQLVDECLRMLATLVSRLRERE